MKTCKHCGEEYEPTDYPHALPSHEVVNACRDNVREERDRYRAALVAIAQGTNWARGVARGALGLPI